jgi:hypothetical protein
MTAQRGEELSAGALKRNELAERGSIFHQSFIRPLVLNFYAPELLNFKQKWTVSGCERALGFNR